MRVLALEHLQVEGHEVVLSEGVYKAVGIVSAEPVGIQRHLFYQPSETNTSTEPPVVSGLETKP